MFAVEREMKKYRKKPIVIEAYQWFEVSEYKEGVKRVK